MTDARVMVSALLAVVAVVAGSCVEPPPPVPVVPVPAGVVATAGDARASISWTPSGQLGVSYLVEHADDPDGPYRQVQGPLTATTSVVAPLINDVAAWFRVIATDAAGNRSLPSAPASAVPGVTPPAPSTTTTARPGSDVTVTAGEFTAVVPAGTVNAPTPVTVTPLPLVEGQLPAVDVHIHGPWNPNAGGIEITLPFPFDSETAPVVFHDEPAGMTFSSGSYVSVEGDGPERSVTVVERSLSKFYTGPVLCDNGQALQLLGLGCIDHRGSANTYIREQTERMIRESQAADAAHLPCGNGIHNAAAVGRTHSAINCQALGLTGFSEFRNRSGDGLLKNIVAVRVTQSGQPANATVIRDSTWLIDEFAEAAGDDFLYPGSTISFNKGLDNHETTIHWATDRSKTLEIAFLVALSDLTAGALMDRGHVAASVAQDLTGCSSRSSLTDALECARDIVASKVDSIMAAAANHWNLPKVAELVPTAAVIMRGITVGQLVASIGSAVVPDSGTTHLIHSTPAEKPATDTRSTWIARNPRNGRSVLVTGTEVRPIVGGATFDCLARALHVWDIPNLWALRQITSDEPATCATAPYQLWDPRPAPAGNVGVNVILRNDDGSAWLINSAGEIQTIPDGGTYECLAHTNPIIWNVDQQSIANWAPIGISDASCGAGSGSTNLGVKDRLALAWGPGEFELSGTLSPSGSITIPPTSIVFAPRFLQVEGSQVTVRLLPTSSASGTFNSQTGAVTLTFSVQLKLEGQASGVSFGENCRIGPINLAITTGQNGTLTGNHYNALTKSVSLVSSTFSVPGWMGCGPLGLANGPLNDQFGLPSGVGNNSFTIAASLGISGESVFVR